MKNNIDPLHLQIIAIFSAFLALLSFVDILYVIPLLVITVSIIFFAMFGDEEYILLSAIVGSIPVWIAIYLSFLLEDVPKTTIRIYILGFLFIVELTALVTLWIQSLEKRKQKKIEESIQREE
jgi:hypothetical protein